MRAGHGLVALLTDFGTRDWYVAALKGVLLSRSPRARLVDITHELPPQDIVAGGFTLAAAVPSFPAGTVFLAIVDPGVGTSRALLAARADGRWFVGPDNGLLAPSLAKAGSRTVVTLTNRRYWEPSISRIFHGRDIMAPVAAYLARGGALQRLGPVRSRVVPWPIPSVRECRGVVSGVVVHIDVFGNLITTLEATRWLGQHPEGRVRLRYRGRGVTMVSSYAEGPPNELVAVVGSLGLIELAVPLGSAAARTGARRGDPVWLLRRDR